MNSRSWHRLADLEHDPARFGHKAVRLARARAAGVNVIEGWVLPVGEDLDDPAALRICRQLLDLSDETEEWILRSSSPGEDRPGASAAGLFRSETAAAHPALLGQALQAVRRGGRARAVRELLGRDATAVAVLAQPLVGFRAWATMELRGPELNVEGWKLGEQTRPWRWRGPGEEFSIGPPDEGLQRILSHARAQGEGPWLFEVGIGEGRAQSADHVWLLQLRPAPSRAPRPRPRGGAPVADAPTLPGWGLHVHPGDEERTWIADVEHCPWPVTPLLAGVFGAWIARPERPSPSRLHRGIWYDPEATGLSPVDPQREVDELRARHSELTISLRSVRTAADAVARTPDATTLSSFFDRWLEFQELYFTHSLRGARTWAREQAGQGRALGRTAAAERVRRWQGLGRRIEAELPSLARAPQALEEWRTGQPQHPLAGALEEERRRCEHLCSCPYDGRGEFWGEDPLPLWREIQRWRRIPVPSEGTTRPGDLASVILRAGEDDNEALYRAYWHLRRALRALAPALHGESAEGLLERLPGEVLKELEAPDPERWARALTSGRALSMQWRSAATRPRTGEGSTMRGQRAAGGRGRGPLRVGRSLADLEADLRAVADELPIAVVSLVTPADAIYFDRLAGLVCEGGDTLGHASILAREHGVPCLVQVGRIGRRLARAEYAFLDADEGELRLLPA